MCSQPQDGGGWGKKRWVRRPLAERRKGDKRKENDPCLGGRGDIGTGLVSEHSPRAKGRYPSAGDHRYLSPMPLKVKLLWTSLALASVPGVPITRRFTALSLFESLTMDSRVASGDSSSGGDFTACWLSEHLRVPPTRRCTIFLILPPDCFTISSSTLDCKQILIMIAWGLVMVTHCSWSLLMRYSKANSRCTSPRERLLVPQLGNGTEEVTHQHRMQVTRKETSRSCWPGRQSWRLSSLLPALTTTRQIVLLWEVSHTGIEAQVAIVPQCLGQPQELLLGDLLLQ